jgi:hypothetical protein
MSEDSKYNHIVIKCGTPCSPEQEERRNRGLEMSFKRTDVIALALVAPRPANEAAATDMAREKANVRAGLARLGGEILFGEFRTDDAWDENRALLALMNMRIGAKNVLAILDDAREEMNVLRTAAGWREM